MAQKSLDFHGPFLSVALVIIVIIIIIIHIYNMNVELEREVPQLVFREYIFHAFSTVE
jgi:hypothetical protein